MPAALRVEPGAPGGRSPYGPGPIILAPRPRLSVGNPARPRRPTSQACRPDPDTAEGRGNVAENGAGLVGGGGDRPVFTEDASRFNI